MPPVPHSRGSPSRLPSSPRKGLAPLAPAALAWGIGTGGFVLLTSGACANGPVTVQYAPDFTRGPSTTLSVFGVFNGGRMSKRAWQELRLRLSPPFDQDTCEVAYGDRLLSTAPSLSSAVDEYATTNGVTDDLLDQFGPMAKGAMIVVITISGHPPEPIDEPRMEPQTSAPPKVHGHRGGGGGLPPTDRKKGEDESVFEVSASLFSVRLHHSVAAVDMTYSGSSVDEAFKTFANKLATEIPNSTCSGWNWDVHVDDKRIREMVER
jgi:hypothetical protein